MNNRFSTLISGFERNPPCAMEEINRFRFEFAFAPPADYLDFMSQSNGGEGTIGNRSYLVLWKIEDIKSNNEGYGVNEFAPGLILLGSDGGDLAYAFDTRFEPVRIVEVSFIGMGLSEVRKIGTSFVDFIAYLYDCEQSVTFNLNKQQYELHSILP